MADLRNRQGPIVYFSQAAVSLPAIPASGSLWPESCRCRASVSHKAFELRMLSSIRLCGAAPFASLPGDAVVETGA